MTRLDELFADLADEAKTYDVTERALMISGRRRRLRLIVAPAVAATAVLSVVIGLSMRPEARPRPEPLASTMPSPVKVRDLPLACVPKRMALPKGATHAMLTGGDPAGRYLLGILDNGDDARRRPVIWEGDQIRLPAPPGTDPHFTDINSGGVAVGTSMVRNSKGWLVTSAWVYRDGKFTTLKGGSAMANAINERGVIVGSADGQPVVWRNPTAQPEYLPDAAGAEPGGVLDIDEDGTMVSLRRVWQLDGTPVALPAKFGAFHIRNGWVTGRSEGKAARWNMRTGVTETYSGELTGINGYASANGWLAGSTKGGKLQLVSPSEHLELPPPPGDPYPDAQVRFVSEDGHTIGGYYAGEYGAKYEFRSVAVLWRCS